MKKLETTGPISSLKSPASGRSTPGCKIREDSHCSWNPLVIDNVRNL
uniref:Uncharacterized protein n=1 Tax=Anguilla anguilla TaxID=7936 RepID=A0A0E9PZX2_ANGAN